MKRRLAALCLVALTGLAALAGGCHTAKLLAPPPPLRAASAAPFAVDVEFAEPVDSVSAADVTHYVLAPAGGGPPASLQSATRVDGYYGRVVELIVPDWLGAAPDSTDFDLTAGGVLGLDGARIGARTVRFRTGLSWGAPVREVLAAHCDGCHGASRQDGSYRTDSYDELFGGGTNTTPNVIAGDPACLLVVKCKPGNSMFKAGDLSYLDYAILANWIGSYAARR